MGRKPNEETSILYSKGAWQAYVYAGRGSDGRLKRVHRQLTAPQTDEPPEVFVQVVRALEAERDAGRDITSRRWKFEGWLVHWHATIAPLTAGYNTLKKTYGNSIRNYLAPMLGGFYLDELTASKFNQLYYRLQVEGLAESTIGLIHATARAALSAAFNEDAVTVNVAAKATAPTVKANSPDPFDDDEIGRILDVLTRRNDPARWYLLLLGMRQGEALGIGEHHYTPDTGMLSIKRQLQRRPYEHGCASPAECARPNCRTADCPGRAWEHGCKDPRSCAKPHCHRKIYPSENAKPRSGKRTAWAKPCGPSCTGHARACPQKVKGACRRHTDCKPCPGGCTKHALKCPRRRGGLVLVDYDTAPASLDGEPVAQTRGRPRKRSQEQELDPKTEAGNRRAALPPFMVEAMDRRVAIRAAQRERAGTMWEGAQWGNVLFCDDLGRPVDPRRDYGEWGVILKEAGVRYREPHAGRRTAATTMLKMGTDRRIVMAFFGWASEAMLKRYQDVPDELLIEAAASMGDRYRGSSATGSATGAGDEGVFVRTGG
jgi:integrase